MDNTNLGLVLEAALGDQAQTSQKLQAVQPAVSVIVKLREEAVALALELGLGFFENADELGLDHAEAGRDLLESLLGGRGGGEGGGVGI